MPTTKQAGLADKLCDSIATATSRIRAIFEAERQDAAVAVPIAQVQERRDHFYFDIF